LRTSVTILASLFKTGTEVACADPDTRHVASRVPARAVATANLVLMVNSFFKVALLKNKSGKALVAMTAP
jgi:hypothetical protein